MEMVISWINSTHYLTLAALAGAIILVIWALDKCTGD